MAPHLLHHLPCLFSDLALSASPICACIQCCTIALVGTSDSILLTMDTQHNIFYFLVSLRLSALIFTNAYDLAVHTIADVGDSLLPYLCRDSLIPF